MNRDPNAVTSRGRTTPPARLDALNQHDQQLLQLGYEPKLKRNLGLGSLIIYGLLFFVPLAPVAVFGYVVNESHGAPVLVYLLAAIVMGLSASSYRQMALRFPTAGSIYGYVRLSTGAPLGFIAGWLLLLDYLLMPALLTILAAISLNHIAPTVPDRAFIAIFMLASWLINIAGLQVTTRIGFVLLSIQLVVVAYFVSAVLRGLITGSLHLTWSPLWHQTVPVSGLLAAVTIAALSYLGFDAIATLNEEARGGGQAVGQATTILMVVVTSLFIIQIWAAMVVTPATEFAPGDSTARAFYFAVDAVTPSWFSPLFTLTNAVVAIFACLVVAHAASARLVFAMARDQILPPQLSITSLKGGPVTATTGVAIVSTTVAFVFADQAERLTSLVTFGALTGYVVLHGAVIWRFVWLERSHRYLTHLVVPCLAIASLIIVLANAAASTKMIGTLWFLVGIVFLVARTSASRSSRTPSSITIAGVSDRGRQ